MDYKVEYLKQRIDDNKTFLFGFLSLTFALLIFNMSYNLNENRMMLISWIVWILTGIFLFVVVSFFILYKHYSNRLEAYLSSKLREAGHFER